MAQTAASAEPALPPYSVQHSHIDRIGLSRHSHEDRMTQTAASAEPALSLNGGQHRQWSGKLVLVRFLFPFNVRC
jgi:hypothetical protein